MIKLSTPAVNACMTSGLLPSLNAHCINIYAGTVPEDADAALGSATLLVSLTAGGTANAPLTLVAGTNGNLSKDTNQLWSGNIATSGTPTFYRLMPLTDGGNAATTEVRVQGTVGPTGDMTLTNTTLSSGTPQAINVYNLLMPKSMV